MYKKVGNQVQTEWLFITSSDVTVTRYKNDLYKRVIQVFAFSIESMISIRSSIYLCVKEQRRTRREAFTGFVLIAFAWLVFFSLCRTFNDEDGRC